MAFSDIVRLYYARLQARIVLVQELFAVLGIAVGVALLFASQVASTSLNGSMDRLTGDIVGHMQSSLKRVTRRVWTSGCWVRCDVSRRPHADL